MELHEERYSVSELWWILFKTMYFATPKGDYRRIYYYNKACAFDIETTSTIINDKKYAWMYVWMLGIDGYCIVGRTWNELQTALDKIQEYCGLCENVRLPIYVHNLAYEFQFMKDRFRWSHIFALEERKPVYCVTETGFEFRCSYRLTGMSLAKVGENLRTYHVQKMVGDLDYSKIRHSGTPLTEEEWGYCVHDVLVVMAHIQECLETEGLVTRIPLTKTAYVRRLVKKRTIGNTSKPNWNYVNAIKYMTLEPDEYMQLRRAFQGGFTHASILHVKETLHDVDSYDFTSSYPAVMISEEFPCSAGQKVDIHTEKELETNLTCYCCLFDATFYDIKAAEIYENYISVSRTRGGKEMVINNGRLVAAREITMTITEQDWLIIKRMYHWEKAAIFNFRRYRKAYLPTEFVETIVQLYEDKTQLKDVKGKEVEYMAAKANLNSLYGMAVTDIIRDTVFYDSDEREWGTESPDLEESIEDYNTKRNRFLFYAWGVWVTAYARANLWSGIVSIGDDYVYSDTDSIKMLNADKHLDYIEEYNRCITERIRRALKHHGIEFERSNPKTIEGVPKPIGVWDYEGHYDRFKTLGAKRYLWEKKGKLQLTVAGLGKKDALEYLQSKGDVFEQFDESMYIPKGCAGKRTHVYIDLPSSGTVTDYLGNVGTFEERSSIYLEEADYSLSMGRQFVDFIFRVRTGEEFG